MTDVERLRELTEAAYRVRKLWPNESPYDRRPYAEYIALDKVNAIIELLDQIDALRTRAEDAEWELSRAYAVVANPAELANRIREERLREQPPGVDRVAVAGDPHEAA